MFGSDKYDRILQRKPYGPGKGPRTRGTKKSEYAQQLMEKQKVRLTFGLSEKQFRNLYQAAQRNTEATGQAILRLLELRFDNILFRAGFALTRMQARQMAAHGLFCVNGRRCSVPSYQMKVGTVIEVRPRSLSSALFATNLTATEKYVPPTWLKIDPSKLRIEVLSLPSEDHFEQGLDVQKVIELYSR